MFNRVKSLWSVLRLYQLVIVVGTVSYCLFLNEIDEAFATVAKLQQLSGYKVAIVRGEVDSVVAKRECEIGACNYIYYDSCFEIDYEDFRSCPPSLVDCSDIEKQGFKGEAVRPLIEKQEYNTGKCCNKQDLHDKVCSYNCHYVDTVQYRLRYSDKFIPVTLAETWQNETSVKNFTRTGGYMYGVRRFVALLHKSIEGPVEVYFRSGSSSPPLWELPPLDIGYIPRLVRVGMFILIIACVVVFYTWAKHIYGFAFRRTQKIFAVANPDDHIGLHIV